MSKAAKESKNFEQSISELGTVVAKLEKGEINLDEALLLFQSGVTLAKQCNDILNAAEQKVTVLIKNEGQNA